jgi:hypothetical protein
MSYYFINTRLAAKKVLSRSIPFAILALAISSLAVAQSDLAPRARQSDPAQTGPSGIITTVAGNGYIGEGGNGGLATEAEMSYPRAVALDSAGNFYIADLVGQVVRKVTASTGIISIYAGTGLGGYSGDKGPAIKADLNEPSGPRT